MFIWCTCCQRLVGEEPPYFVSRIRHDICENCAAKPAARNTHSSSDDAHVEFYRQLEQSAFEGDLATCRDKVEEGLAIGLAPVDLASLAVHGVLTDVGERWERGEITIADEHRITRWCESILSILPRSRPEPFEQPDLLGFKVPGNRHYLGPRVAQFFLVERGLKVNIVTPDMPRWEMREMVSRDKPRSVALSAAREEEVPRAIEISQRFRDDGFEGMILLTGSAVRRGQGWPTDEIVAPTVWDVAERLQH